MQIAGSKPPRPDSAAEVKRLLDLDRAGIPYLVHRDAAGTLVTTTLSDRERLTIGRTEECDLALEWDDAVSRVHAEVEHLGGAWVLSDDGLSRNGTFVNGQRVHGRHRLVDRDTVKCGVTPLLFREPVIVRAESTSASDQPITVEELSRMQRKVLIALCRPLYAEGSHGTPATNREIAEELVLSGDAVKTHVRALFHRFQVEDLPQNRKRARLVELAQQAGIIGPHDYA